MDRSSSIFLDKFAVDKLLTEKLEKVSYNPGLKETSTLFDNLEETTVSIEDFVITESQIKFSSENDICYVDIFSTDCSKGDIIFIHGLYEDNKDIYKFLFSMLNRAGYNVYLLTLPHHYQRTEESSSFSGEFFWSADIPRTRKAFKDAVYDLYKLYLFLNETNGQYPDICGFSMGAAVAFNLASRIKLESGITMLNPVTSLSEQAWTSDLWRTIKRDFVSNNFKLTDVIECYKELCPSSFDTICTPFKNINCFSGEYDQIVEIEKTRIFFDKWTSINRDILKCGHLNMLRVPKLANIIDKLNTNLKEVSNNEKLLSVSI